MVANQTAAGATPEHLLYDLCAYLDAASAVSECAAGQEINLAHPGAQQRMEHIANLNTATSYLLRAAKDQADAIWQAFDQQTQGANHG